MTESVFYDMSRIISALTCTSELTCENRINSIINKNQYNEGAIQFLMVIVTLIDFKDDTSRCSAAAIPVESLTSE